MSTNLTDLLLLPLRFRPCGRETVTDDECLSVDVEDELVVRMDLGGYGFCIVSTGEAEYRYEGVMGVCGREEDVDIVDEDADRLCNGSVVEV